MALWKFVWRIIASVTMTAGFVKLISHSSGQSSSISLTISNITGIVRNALNIPPAPLVSCPIMPWLNGILSSSTRAGRRPTLIWVVTKSAPGRASRLAGLNLISIGTPAFFTMRFASAPTISSFSRPSSISTSHSSRTGRVSYRLINPSTNSAAENIKKADIMTLGPQVRFLESKLSCWAWRLPFRWATIWRNLMM